MMSLGEVCGERAASRPPGAPKNVVELDSHRPIPIRFDQSDEVVFCGLADLSATIKEIQGLLTCAHVLSCLPARLFW
jgi:hypothetical protein